MDNRNIFCGFLVACGIGPICIYDSETPYESSLICFRRVFSTCRIRGIFENYPNIVANGIFGYFFTKRDYSDSIPDSDADNLHLRHIRCPE